MVTVSVEYHRFLDPGEWRRWLEVNHSQDDAIWVVIQKVKSPNTGIRYDEAPRRPRVHPAVLPEVA